MDCFITFSLFNSDSYTNVNCMHISEFRVADDGSSTEIYLEARTTPVIVQGDCFKLITDRMKKMG